MHPRLQHLKDAARDSGPDYIPPPRQVSNHSRNCNHSNHHLFHNLVKFKRGLEEELVPPTSRQQGVSELTNFAIEKNSIYTSAKITALPSLSGNCTSIFII